MHNQTTQADDIANQTTNADDIARASKNNATKWWKRGFSVEPSYKIGNPSTRQEAAEGFILTLGLKLPSRPQLEEFQDTIAEVDSILNSNPHDPGDRAPTHRNGSATDLVAS